MATAYKLNTVQKRAKRYCDEILSKGHNTTIVVEWKRSQSYGLNPVISCNDGKMTSVSGCGYCKLSTALADVLCFLFAPGSLDFIAVQSTGGAGVNSVEDTLAKFGYTLKRVSTSKTSDTFTIEKTP